MREADYCLCLRALVRRCEKSHRPTTGDHRPGYRRTCISSTFSASAAQAGGPRAPERANFRGAAR